LTCGHSRIITQRRGLATTAPGREAEGALVDEDADMTPTDGQWLPLAVDGPERPVLCL